MLDRIPEGVGATRPAPVGAQEPIDEPVELAFDFERRIDQHQSALLLRRQMGAKRQPAVQRDDPHLMIAGKALLQTFGVLRMQFDGGQPILLAQEMADDERRTRIVPEATTLVYGGNGLQIGREQRGRLALRRLVEQPAMPSRHSPVRAACEEARS